MNRILFSHYRQLLTLTSLTLFSAVSYAPAQSNRWDDSFISRHAIATVNFNVGRLSRDNENSEALKQLADHVKARHSVELAEIDQFQVVFSRDPKLKFGADTTSNTKIVFRKPRTFNAKAIGKISGYSLDSAKHGGHELFVGKRNSGSWGGMVGSKRALILGVEPMLKSILDSQELELNPAHEISKLRKTDVDVCLTMSGGGAAGDFASQLLGDEGFSVVAKNFTTGLLYLDTHSAVAIQASFRSDQPKALADAIEELIDKGKANLNGLTTMVDQQLEQMKKQEAPAAFTKQAQDFRDSLSYWTDLIQSLKISSTETTVAVASSDKSLAKQLPERLTSLFLQP